MEISKVIQELKKQNQLQKGQHELSKFAVLLPLVEIEKETHILFEVRSLSLRRQPGEICFPGGRIEVGETPEHCAIRETSEELGIDESDIKDVIPMEFMLNAAGNIIYPYVGRVPSLDQLKPNESEVGDLFTVPLSFFKTTEPDIFKIHYKIIPDEDFPFHLIHGGENYKWNTRSVDEHFYQYNGKVIWGLTARILVYFVSLLKE